MITRKQYVSSSIGPYAKEDGHRRHRAYYGQFVNEPVRQLVVARIGIDRLRKCSNEHFTDVPLVEWDALVPAIYQHVEPKMRDAGDYLTVAGGVCVLKEAARQILERTR